MDNDMELGERSRDREAEEEQEEQEEETSFTDDDRRREDESILIIDGSNPIFTRAGDGGGDNIPNARRDAGVMRRHIIHDKKQFLKNGLGITVNKGDGPNPTRLYDELRVTFGKGRKINGATYRGKKILIFKNGNMEYSTDKSKIQYVNEFKKLLRKADAEHQRTPTLRKLKNI